MTLTKNRIGFKPLGDRVVLRRVEADKTTAGGIVLPDSAREKPRRGTVLAVGPGRLLDEGTHGVMQIAVGDEVLFTNYAGTDVEMDSEELVIMGESDILGVVG